jgi:hypothetical protein
MKRSQVTPNASTHNTLLDPVPVSADVFAGKTQGTPIIYQLGEFLKPLIKPLCLNSCGMDVQ